MRIGNIKTCRRCGEPVTRPRSPEHHRRFFGAIGVAFDNWPDHHEFEPISADHLRAFLLCKAGYCNATYYTVPVLSDSAQIARIIALVESLVHASNVPKFPRWRGNRLAVYQAKSIAWDKLPEDEFAPIAQAVDDECHAIIGLSFDQLFEHRDIAA